MYIPTMFYALGSCVRALPTGSVTPTGVTLGTVTDGTNSWNYIEVEQGHHAYIEVDFGTTEEARLILIGQGGQATSSLGEGGGAAGDVIIQDVALQPGQYYMSASDDGGDITIGGSSAFRTDFADSADNVVFLALGGNESDNQNGGRNTNFIGGTGDIQGGQQGGGGGAGSTSSGGNTIEEPGPQVGAQGGQGGSGSVIPSPFNNAFPGSFGSYVAEGGPGGDPGDLGAAAQGIGLGGKYGDGGFVSNIPTPGENVNRGESRAFLFIPISPNCPEEYSLIFSDTNACTASVSDVFYTAANTTISLGNTLFTDFGLTETTASLFRTSGSNEYFSTNAFGDIITVNEICPTSYIFQFSDTNACTSSLSGEFFTSGSDTLSNGNILYTDADLLLTTASVFNTSGSALTFFTDTNGLISLSGSQCVPCQRWEFSTAGSEGTAVYTLCGTSTEITQTIPPNQIYSRCIRPDRQFSMTNGNLNFDALC